MFCHITESWRGRPLIDHEVVVQLIGNTTTDTGLTIQAELDQNAYLTGITISDQQMAELNLSRATFHGNDWNYIIKPR
jgi:outer membrane receptor for ferric coprogen and ferric-rhodotorulic acid